MMQSYPGGKYLYRKNIKITTAAFLWLFLTGFNYYAGASQISTSTAESVALNFFKLTYPYSNHHNSLSASLVYTQAEADSTIDFYIFNMEPVQGFVIVAAQDNVMPVIAYSAESSFNVNFSKTGLTNWVNKTAGQIHNTALQGIQADIRISSAWSAYQQGILPGTTKSTGISPLCATTWNQEPYYNQDCPMNPNDNQLCVTGCVATAMAQIMKRWNYPPQGAGSFSYDDATGYGYQLNIGVLSANFGTTTYPWTQMPNYITGNNAPVAQLMSQCGISVAMDYSDAGSGAYVLQNEADAAFGFQNAPCAQYSYANYFLYDPATLQGIYQNSYSALQWDAVIEAELNAGRPVQYEGFDPNAGGHTWVCDGYDVNDNLHMNWGWGGIDNGYFAATNLSAGGYTFDYDDAALIGIEPPGYTPPSDSICNALASFTYQSLGGNLIQFSNASTSNAGFTSNWTFYNSSGVFTTSSAANPQVNFIGQAPYSAKLVIVDTLGVACGDSITQSITYNPNTLCLTLQVGTTYATGSEIATLHPASNFDYTSYSELMSIQWTNGGLPVEDRGLFRYDLSQIPAGSIIVSANLSLYSDTNAFNGYIGQPTYGSNNASNLYLVTSSWSPSQVTWNTQPTIDNNNAVLLSQSANYNEDYLNIDLTNFAQTWVNNPGQNYGMLLEMITQNYYNSMIFCSPSYPDSTRWPKLEVCYIPGSNCHTTASFVQQNLGNGMVQFTNTSSSLNSFTSNWTFYNNGVAFTTSAVTNPLITFTGQQPYSAQLIVLDSSGLCSDTLTQVVNLNSCLTLRSGSTRATGSDIASFHPNSNFDFTSFSVLMANHWTNGGVPTEDRGLLRFDLSQIPAGSSIVSANLSLQTDTSSNNGYINEPTYGTNNASNLHLVTSTWDPATVTWASQPTVSNSSVAMLAQSTNYDENYLNIDISNFVQAWVNTPNQNYGMMLEMVTQNHYNSMIFCSPGYTDSTKWPQLDICYQLPSPCHTLVSFTQLNLGNGTVQFTNTSTYNMNAVPKWTFYNINGAFATSNFSNPEIVFTGQPPYSATLEITDSTLGCVDTLNQAVNITSCISFQTGSTKATGSDIASFHPTSNFDYTSFQVLMANHWTNGGVPTEDRGLFKFNLSQITIGTSIVSANLSLFSDTNSANGIAGEPTYGTNNASYLYLVTSSWDPALVTWNTQPTTSATNEISLPQSTNYNENYLNLDLSNFVQMWVNNPSLNYGMLLELITQNYYNSMIFCSPGYPDSTKYPKLDICYFTPVSCSVSATFNYQNLGNDSIWFTNTSISNQAYTSSWVFYNSSGAFATSSITNPLVMFTGQPPYSATLTIGDTLSSNCSDSISQPVTPNSSTAIFQVGNPQTGLLVFPNPNNGLSFTIQLPSGYDVQTTDVKIYDILGREVPVSDIHRATGYFKLSLPESSAGIYTVLLRYHSQQLCGKLILVK